MRLRVTAALLSWLLPSALAKDEAAVRLYINYSPAPRAKDLLTHNLCILDPYAQVDLKPGLAKGHHYLAYLSAVEVATGSPFYETATARAIPLVGENATWNSRLMDLSSPIWPKLMLEDGAEAAAAAGYNGFFFDTVDAIERLPTEMMRTAARKALVTMLQQLRTRWPKHRIVINRGFPLLRELKGLIDGVLVESVYQTYDFATKRYAPVKPTDSEWLVHHIKTAQAMGFAVYGVDYVKPANRELALTTAERLRTLGVTPLVTTPELRGATLAP
jgi:hypothetical protein